MKTSPTYGVRSRRPTNAAVRFTARTYGKARIGTYVEKAGGHITVESEAERLVAHILCVDPRVRSFKPQPFTVDLVGERLLFTHEEVSEARKTRGGRNGECEYTPDFSTVQIDGLQRVYEVKLQGYEGDDKYWAKIERAKKIMDAYCFPLSTVIVPADERHPLVINAQLLKQVISRVRTSLKPDVIARVESYCESGPVLLRALSEDLKIPNNLIPPLLATGALQADIAHCRIGASLELSAAYGDLSHLFLIEELQS
ncbi:hypothetical protein [Herminiimonas aquatilis]|uniref:TnsA endonuclease-like protein n=1 Tax=Herminiimonas aquatilis TaxID=345342 RepID=A0ABW2J4I4_9BURK